MRVRATVTLRKESGDGFSRRDERRLREVLERAANDLVVGYLKSLYGPRKVEFEDSGSRSVH